MGQDDIQVDDRFRPLRAASGLRLMAAMVLGPFLWWWGSSSSPCWCTDRRGRIRAADRGRLDSRGLPGDLLGWLTERYRAVFTQDENALARARSNQPLGRIQVTRETTGGELHAMLLSGEQ